jgi:hypothetical protein
MEAMAALSVLTPRRRWPALGSHHPQGGEDQKAQGRQVEEHDPGRRPRRHGGMERRGMQREGGGENQQAAGDDHRQADLRGDGSAVVRQFSIP